MSGSKQSYAAAYFDDATDAEKAIFDLRDAGFKPHEIGCTFSEQHIARHSSSSERGFWDAIESVFFRKDADTPAEEFQVRPALGIPPRYRERLKAGGAFLTVHGNDFEDAKMILMENNGQIVTDMFEREPVQPMGRESVRPIVQASQDREEYPRIQLLSEALRIHKERVTKGEVRVRKEVITEMQTLQVPVSREELVIERIPGDGRETSGELGAASEIRIPLWEERVEVQKVPVVKEEVVIGKKKLEEIREVSEEVRREELRVETDADLASGDKIVGIDQKKTQRDVA